MTKPTVEVLKGILNEPDHRKRDTLLNDFITEREPLYRRYAKGLCRTNSVRQSQHSDDVLGIVRESAWKVITDAMEDPSLLETVYNWEAITWRRARWEVRRYLDREVSPASGMTTARRRHRKVQEMRSRLRTSLGREPTDVEIVDAANDALSHLKNAANQGMLITEEDLRLPTAVGDVDGALDSFTYVDYAEDYVIHHLEGRQLVERIVDECFDVSIETGQVASIWIADVYTDGGALEGQDTITHITSELGLTATQVHEYVSLIRRIALETVRQMGLFEEEKIA